MIDGDGGGDGGNGDDDDDDGDGRDAVVVVSWYTLNLKIFTWLLGKFKFLFNTQNARYLHTINGVCIDSSNSILDDELYMYVGENRREREKEIKLPFELTELEKRTEPHH